MITADRVAAGDTGGAMEEDTGRSKRQLLDELDALREQLADRTDCRVAEEALRKSQEKYRDLFQNANDAIFLLDARLNYVDANDKAVELTQYPREELLTMNVWDLVPEEQRPRSRTEFEKLRREGSYEKFRGRLRTRNTAPCSMPTYPRPRSGWGGTTVSLACFATSPNGGRRRALSR
jgi:PAS domain S-box-containing protein